MKLTSFRSIGRASAVTLVLIAAATSASAEPMDFYAGPAITDALKADPRACLNVGDAVSCSAGMLNLLHYQYFGTALSQTGSTALSENNPTKVNGYIIAPSGQGQLKQSIVLGSGGAAANPNDTIDPLATEAQDGFKTNNAGQDYAATGKTGQTAGNLGSPPINNLNSAFDQAGTWDVDLDWLINALTIDGMRRELMIGFDYNQPRNSSGSVDYWSLITVIDYKRDDIGAYLLDGDGKGIIDKQVNYEIKNDYSGYAGFVSGKTFNDQPSGHTGDPDANEFATVNTRTCYQMTNGIVTGVIPIPGGQCPAGYSAVNNATGDSTTEIIAFLPELNFRLEEFLNTGYDAISVRMLFGCFEGSNPKSGQGYLSAGATTNCDGGGNVDVFLMAGVPGEGVVPEPGSLALFGASLAGLYVVGRRRRAVK